MGNNTEYIRSTTGVSSNVSYDYVPEQKLNNSFVRASTKERFFVTCFIDRYDITNYSVTPVDSYNSFEILFDYECKSWVCEFKIRKCESDRYNDVLIEKVKFQRLKEAGAKYSASPLYLCVYHDETFRLFDLTKVSADDINWKQEWHYKDGNDFSKGKDLKWVGYLPNEKGIKRNIYL